MEVKLTSSNLLILCLFYLNLDFSQSYKDKKLKINSIGIIVSRITLYFIKIKIQNYKYTIYKYSFTMTTCLKYLYF